MNNPHTIPVLPDRLNDIKRFLADNRFGSADLQPLAGDASFRRYIRIRQGDDIALLMDAPPGKEDVRPYITMAEHLCRHGYSAPRVLAADPAKGFVLIEDFGTDSFTSLLKTNDSPRRQEELYGAAIDLMAHWHKHTGPLANPSRLELPLYNEKLLMREIELFSNWYLPQVAGMEKARALQAEYLDIWRGLLAGTQLDVTQLVHRDYHADNLMWLPAREGIQRVGLLDFQDAVYGDAAYDIVSLLEDARRDVQPTLAEAMIRRYVAGAGADEATFRAAYALLGAQRNSKIVGIFVRLAARDDKQHYLHYLPRVWGHLNNDLQHPLLAPLKAWTDKYIPQDARGAIELRHKAAELGLSA